MREASELPSYIAACVWPEPLPDETLYSLVTHISQLNGWQSEREACGHLFGDRNSTRLGDVRVDMAAFVVATSGVYGDAAEVMRRFTCLPFFENLGSLPDIEVAQSWGPGDMEASKEAGRWSLASLSNGHAPTWRWCPQCQEEDLRDHGRAYWHRRYQLPMAFVCIKHGAVLQEANARYWVRQQHLFTPDSLPERLTAAPACPPEADLSLALALAKFVSEAAEEPIEGQSPAVVQGAIFDGLQAAGLVSARGTVRRQPFLEALTGFYAGLGGIETVAGLGKQRLSSLIRALTDTVQSRPAVLNLMLAFWLFGSWELFREHCLWRKAIDNSSPGGHILPGGADKEDDNDKKSARTLHRQACMELLKTLPQASRTDFWKQNPRSCRWLIQYDSRWIDAHLPPEKAGTNQLALFDNK